MTRSNEFRHCPFDSCLIPLVAELRNWPRPSVRFFWCQSCQVLFAFVGQNELGSRLAASFVYDQESEAFTLKGTAADPKDVEIVQEVMPKMTYKPWLTNVSK